MQYFLPQLLPFYMRFFHVYDSSLQGNTVEDYMAQMQLSQPQILRKNNEIKVRVPIAEVPVKSKPPPSSPQSGFPLLYSFPV